MLDAFLRALVKEATRSCLPPCSLRLKVRLAVDCKNEPENAARSANRFTPVEKPVIRSAARVDTGLILADEIGRGRQAIEILGFERGLPVGCSQPGVCRRPFLLVECGPPERERLVFHRPMARVSEFSQGADAFARRGITAIRQGCR